VIPRRRAFALATALLAATGGVAAAQSGTITVAAGTATTANIAPGAKFTVPVIADMSAAGGLDLASLQAHVTWTSSRMTLDSIKAAGFGSVADTVTAGSAAFAVFDANGTTTTTTVVNLFFTAGTNTAGSRIQLTPVVAGNSTGTSITNQLRTRSLDVCVAPQTPWGDANADGAVNIIDAQQIARFAVGLSVTSPSAVVTGDVNADGTVDIRDAQQIAASVVGLAASSRIGTMASSVPAIAGVSISPSQPALAIAQNTQLLAVPVDANGTPLIGCTPINWASSNSAAATIDDNGIVTGVASGSSTISAKSVNGNVASATVTVSSPLTTLTMSRDTATIHLGEQLALSATAKDGAGAVMSIPITFTSSDSSVATVSSTGQVTAVNVGAATITASAQGKSATANIQISPLAENSLATGDDFSCMLTVTGAAYCWGSDSTFQLGDGTTTNRNTPVAASLPATLRFTQIVAASKGVCGLSTTEAVYCWGARYPSNSPPFVNPTLSSGALHVKAMAGWGSGPDSGLCMLDSSGTVYCIGDGSRGQMGTGVRSENDTPTTPVLGNITFQSITAALNSVCGLSSGTAYCWGTDNWGELGTGSPANPAQPAPVTGGLTFASIVAGRTLTCGVTTAGAGYCWGSGFYGGDGDGDVVPPGHTSPSLITGGLTFKTVWGQTGPRDVSSSCGLTTDGTAYCWGSNSSGQLGTTVSLGPNNCVTGPCTGTPQQVETTSKFVTLRPGGEHVCGITTDHMVLCWGKNSAGQLGDGSNDDRHTPVVVAGGVRVP
jgi:alpha-tubulin suppressor-like RCC1 family protein